MDKYKTSLTTVMRLRSIIDCIIKDGYTVHINDVNDVISALLKNQNNVICFNGIECKILINVCEINNQSIQYLSKCLLDLDTLIGIMKKYKSVMTICSVQRLKYLLHPIYKDITMALQCQCNEHLDILANINVCDCSDIAYTVHNNKIHFSIDGKSSTIYISKLIDASKNLLENSSDECDNCGDDYDDGSELKNNDAKDVKDIKKVAQTIKSTIYDIADIENHLFQQLEMNVCLLDCDISAYIYIDKHLFCTNLINVLCCGKGNDNFFTTVEQSGALHTYPNQAPIVGYSLPTSNNYGYFIKVIAIGINQLNHVCTFELKFSVVNDNSNLTILSNSRLKTGTLVDWTVVAGQNGASFNLLFAGDDVKWIYRVEYSSILY